MKDIKRKFETIVDLGSGPGHFSKLLEPDKTRKVIMIDSSGMSLQNGLHFISSSLHYREDVDP